MKAHSQETRKAFGQDVANGMPQGKAYAKATGVDPDSAAVGAVRWMRLPEIQEFIQRESQANLLEAGRIAIDKLRAGLEAIDEKKITPTGAKLITLGLQMSGILDRQAELRLNDNPNLDPEVLAALKVLGNKAMMGVQDTRLNEEGVYEVIGDSTPESEPASQ